MIICCLLAIDSARGGAGSRGLEIQWRIQITARQASPRPLKCVVSRARPADEARLAACKTLESH